MEKLNRAALAEKYSERIRASAQSTKETYTFAQELADLKTWHDEACAARDEAQAETERLRSRLVAAVTHEHKAVATLVKAGKAGTEQSIADAWGEVRAAHEAVESLLAADERGEG